MDHDLDFENLNQEQRQKVVEEFVNYLVETDASTQFADSAVEEWWNNLDDGTREDLLGAE